MRAVTATVRAAARSAGSASPMLASTLPAAAARTATKAAVTAAVQCRHFAKKAGDEPNLHGLLLSEAEYEETNTEIDQEFEEVKKQVLKNFKLNTKKGQGTIELTSTHGSEKITITFDCQDEIDTSDFLGEENVEVEHEGDDVGTQGINFLVEVEKNGDKMMFGCIAADTNDVLISQVRHVPRGESVDDTDAYSGPMVEVLDPALVQLMTEYLADRKIDTDLSYFIGGFAQQKESEEYVAFCRKFAEFVTK